MTFRHIRTLQQENKELRAALEEHQNALELIMSKYRQHVTRYEFSSFLHQTLKAQEVISFLQDSLFYFTLLLLLQTFMKVYFNPTHQAGQCSPSRLHEHQPVENPGGFHSDGWSPTKLLLLQALAERTEKVCEMAAVMKVGVDLTV